MSLVKRTHAFLMPPSHFEVSGCSCGNEKTQWSEYEGHLWCAICEKDFKPEHGGVFDGPIPINTALMLGLCFDRVDLSTNQVETMGISQSGQIYYSKPVYYNEDFFNKETNTFIILIECDK